LHPESGAVSTRLDLGTELDPGAFAGEFGGVADVVAPDVGRPRGIADGGGPARGVGDVGAAVGQQIYESVEGLGDDGGHVEGCGFDVLLTHVGQEEQIAESWAKCGRVFDDEDGGLDLGNHGAGAARRERSTVKRLPR
jgi:hypothetical protein